MWPPSNTRTSHGHDPRTVCAGTDGLFIPPQTAPERGWNMNARFGRLAVEALEGREVPSAVATGDFNHDGLVDVAAVTSSTSITVSLANPDGSYTVSATLAVPKSQPIGGISVDDYNGDGNLDIRTGGLANNRLYSHTWLGNGDGTFDHRHTQTSNPKWWI